MMFSLYSIKLGLAYALQKKEVPSSDRITKVVIVVQSDDHFAFSKVNM